MSVGRFIAGVGAFIYHTDTGRYLFLQRAAGKDFEAGAWECVTGRVDQGEDFEAALHREVREELGVAVTIDFIIGTTHFYRGEPAAENELLGLIYHCSLENPEAIRRSDEHQRHVWLTVDEALAQFRGAPENTWLLRTLVRAERVRRQLPSRLLATFHSEGFNINGERMPAGEI